MPRNVAELIDLACIQASLHKHNSKNVAEQIDFGMFTIIIAQTQL